MSRFGAWLRLARLPFLLGGVTFHFLGASLAWQHGMPVDFVALALTQLTVTAAQLMTHGSNEYFDLSADRLNAFGSRWSGGSRVLVAGDLPPSAAFGLAITCGAVAVAGATVLAARVRPDQTLACLLLAALAIAWTYSAPPVRLVARSAGEIAGALLLAALTPLIGYLAQGGGEPFSALLALLPLVALQFAMLVTVSLPDRQGDLAGGKGTLAVRLGPRRAARAASGAIVLAYATAAGLAWLNGDWIRLRIEYGTGPNVHWLVPGAYLVWAPIVGAWLVRSLEAGGGNDPARWNRVGFWSIGLVIGSALTVIAVLLGADGL